MPARFIAASLLSIVVCACGGAPGATSGAATTGASSGPGSTGSNATAPVATAAASAAAIDLSNIDACALVEESVVEALTGEKDFVTDERSGACFWGVPRPGVPQYLEVQISRSPASLQGYGITFNGVSCPGIPLPGVGVEAVGAVCTGAQKKVWLAAMDRGVFVQVIVNEPKGALTPEGLAAAVNAVLAGLP